jgi:RNA polymerase sigma-70 factor (ECF subfamily)
MPKQASGSLTLILQKLRDGDAEAQERLLQLVYDELRGMASRYLGEERLAHSWQATDLTHEALTRLLGTEVLGQTTNRAHFFSVASRTMRQLLVEHARLRRTRKRGCGWRRVRLDELVDYFEEQRFDVIAVREALDRLAGFSERQSQVVTLRFFCGFSVAEIAEQLAVSVSTVESDFRIARAWLYGQLA